VYCEGISPSCAKADDVRVNVMARPLFPVKG
jgi:hypothetical protein